MQIKSTPIIAQKDEETIAFHSIHAAAKHFDVQPSSIYRASKRPNGTCKGYLITKVVPDEQQ